MGWLRRLRGTIAPSRATRVIDEEARFHIDELTDEYVRQGVPPDEARRRAARRFGDTTLTRERTRDVDTLRWLGDAGQDVRFAARTLVRQPGFALVAVLTLALGIGANTAIFSLFDAILLRSLPVRDPSRLVLFTDSTGEGTSTGTPPLGAWELFSMDAYRHLRDGGLPFESLAAVRSGEASVMAHVAGTDTPATRAQAHLVSGNFFQTMAAEPALGRALGPRDDRPNAAPAAVVSHSFWQNTLRGRSDVVGVDVVLNTTAFTIVGVMPAEFFGERVRHSPDVWVPLAFQPQIELRPSVLDRTDTYWLNLIGRLSPGATRETAQSAATAALQQFLTAQAGTRIEPDRVRDIRDSRVELYDGSVGVSTLRTLYSQPLHILLVVVGLVLLIACANVANLLLTRAAARRAEFSMRIALGAGRFRLVRQLLTESLLLAGLGAAAGALLAQWVARGLLTLVVSQTSPIHASLSAPVLGFTVAVAVVAGVLFGVAPALHASRLDLVSAMRARQGGGTASRGRSRAADVLVAVQIAVSLVLLIGAGLFARSLLNVQRQPIGFVPDHVLLARLSPRLAGYTPESAVAFYARLYERLAALPGVDGVTLARYSPFGGSRSVNSGSVQGYTPKAGEEVALETVPVGPDYPTTMGMALLKGRALNRRDTAAGPKVGMVNEAFVRRFLPRVNPVGRHFSIDTDDKVGYEIVGVLADAQFHDARDAIEPIVFTSILQDPSQFSLDCEIALRSSGDTASAARALRQTIAELDPNLPVNDPRTLREQVRSSFDSDRLAASLVAFFSLLALALAAVGLYGTIAQQVALRTNEIGVRMALGADRRGVVWMVLRRVLVLLAAGVIVGLPTAILAGRLVASQLFGLRPVDWLSYGIAVGGLVLVALAAGFVPARRATRVDPVRALRAE